MHKADKVGSGSTTLTFNYGLVENKCDDDLGTTLGFDEIQLNETSGGRSGQDIWTTARNP